MSTPGSIKPAEVARTGSSVTGTFDIRELDRLHDELARQDGRLNYAIVGSLTERGHDVLHLQVSGQLWLKCQRCLEPVAYDVESSRDIVFASDPHAVEVEYEAEDTDVVDAVESLELKALIEDEVLLSMPLSPRHDTGDCHVKQGDAVEARKSPFAVLEELRGGKRDGGDKG